MNKKTEEIKNNCDEILLNTDVSNILDDNQQGETQIINKRRLLEERLEERRLRKEMEENDLFLL